MIASDNQMTNDGTYTYMYDAVGNLTEKTKGTGLETWYYSYDNANELTGVNETSNGTTSILLITYKVTSDAGTLPSARPPTMCQSTVFCDPWTAVPTLLVTDA